MIRRTSCEVLLCASVYYAAGITAFDEWNCRADVACVGADLRVRPQNRLRSGEDGRTHRSAPTEIGVTAFDEWNCRVDVIRVWAELRVRPQNRLRSGEDRRTHRSAPTVGAPTPTSGSPEEQSTELPKREKLRFLLACELRKQRVTRKICGIEVSDRFGAAP